MVTLKFLIKFTLISIGTIVVIFVGVVSYWGIKRGQDIIDSQALTESIVNYEIEGYQFSVPGGYLSTTRRFRPGKTRALWLVGQMPEFSIRIDDPDYKVNIRDPDRVRAQIFKRLSFNPMKEHVPVNYDLDTRTITPKGWVRYESDLGFLYYKELNTSNASRMRCSTFDNYPNPGCEATYYLNDRLQMTINFRFLRWEDWEEIEDKVKNKILEFMAEGEDFDKST